MWVPGKIMMKDKEKFGIKITKIVAHEIILLDKNSDYIAKYQSKSLF